MGKKFRSDYEKADEKSRGLTVLEALVALVMLVILASIVIPTYMAHIERARVVKAVAEIKEIAESIEVYRRVYHALPESLADLGYQSPLDPWGHPYQYVDIENKRAVQVRHKPGPVPINTLYDLYSMGKDGKSQENLNGKSSRDDIIFADDGDYIGPVSRY